MKFRIRAAGRLSLVLSLIVALIAGPLPAAAAPDTGPWLYRGSDVPQDKAWVFGELPNGLRYAVRRNDVPPEQMSVRIAIDAGSLYETDAERGFAHLIEHLTFRQSKYLGNAEAIPTWQRLGATFGSDTNAETTPTHTVYKLDIPAITPAKIDESFRLLSGMIEAPTLSEANVRTEVPIVLAEMRERGGAQARVVDRTREILFAGQPLAERAPIGTTQTLNAATSASVKAFHSRWYRPENTVITVVADADTATLERMVKQYFGDWKGTGPLTPQPDFGTPKPTPGADPANPVSQAEVIVEPGQPRGITYAILRPWQRHDDTIAYNQGLLIDYLAAQLINRRLEARARGGGSYLAAAVSQDKTSRSVDGTFVSVTPLGDDWKAALRDVRAVIADALAKPPTQEEIQREMNEFDLTFASQVEQERVQATSKLADDIVEAVDIREAVASPETILNVFRNMKAQFTPAAVAAHTKAMFQGQAIRAVMVSPTPVANGSSELRAAMLAPVKADGGSRLAASSIKFSDLPPLGKPGSVTGSRPTGVLGIEAVTLSNGVRALIFPTDGEPGRVMVKVRWGNGRMAFAPQDAPYLAVAPLALASTGFGKVDQEALDRITNGRRMGFNLQVRDNTFAISADTRAADLSDQLYLLAAKFAQPRWDASPVIRAREGMKLGYDSLAGSPATVLQRDLDWIAANRDPRYKTPTPAELSKVTPEGFKAVWAPILASGPIEVDIFGDFKREDALAALEKTFGALAPRAPLAPAHQTPAVPVGSSQPISLTHAGDPDQAAAIVAWPTGGGRAGVRESRQLEVLSQLMQNRLFDRMREKLGASYAPQVSNDWPLDLPRGGKLMAMAQVSPDKVSAFYQAADEIAAELASAPASADELGRITEPLRQAITRASTGNTFWLLNTEGAAFDPSVLNGLSGLLNDYTQITPAEVQALAAKYLVKGNSWRLQVLPQKGGGAGR